MVILSATGSALGSLALPWRSIFLSTLALALYLFAGPAPDALVYDRNALAAGECWRLISAHWVHSDAEHAFWDIAALALFGALFEARLGWRLVSSLVIGSLAVDACLWWAMRELERYCGLSGIINALLAAGLWESWRQTRDPLIPWIAAGVCAKIAIELATGGALFTYSAWPSVPRMHAVGFTAGLAAAVTTAPKRRLMG